MTDFTHTTTLTWSGSGSASFGGSLADSADAEDNRNLTLATTVDTQFDIAIQAGTRLKHLFILSDVLCTLRTNTSVGVDTLTLQANAPLSYSYAGGTTGPFSTDVTAIWAQADTAPCTLRIRVLQDSTP
jgi:hypothetical protein